jgi:hypothetical protein
VTESDAASLIAPFLFCDLPLETWIAASRDSDAEPWSSLARSADLDRDGHRDEAVALWRQVADSPDVESRQVLQAWHFLREAGVEPPADIAKRVLGMIVEMPVQGGHDTLAGYADGSARYLNFSGKVVIWEQRADPDVSNALNAWLAAGEDLVQKIGVWDLPTLPDLSPGHARVLMLTPSGPHFGQGPAGALLGDPLARNVIEAAVAVMQLLMTKAAPP